MRIEEFKMTIGCNIEELLNDWGMTQQELADRLHVSRQTINSYITGHRLPPLDTVINIMNILDCGLEDLVDTHEFIE